MNENPVYIYNYTFLADLVSLIHLFYGTLCSKFVSEFWLAFKGNTLQIHFAKRQRKINNVLASIECILKNLFI